MIGTIFGVGNGIGNRIRDSRGGGRYMWSRVKDFLRRGLWFLMDSLG